MIHFRKKTRHGFTLIEIMLVIGLIAVIMGTVVAKFGGVLEDSKPGLVKIAVNSSIPVLLMSHHNKTGHWPKSLSEVTAKIEPDAWNRAYQYKYPGTRNPGSYDLWSMGPDGSSGTPDDIGNWDT